LLLTTSGIPQQIVAEINALHLPVWAMLLSLNIVLLVMGSFLEPPAAILILTPLLPPFGLNIFGGGVRDAARHYISRRPAIRSYQFLDAFNHHICAGDFDGTPRQRDQ
jgi:hypothetical protein